MLSRALMASATLLAAAACKQPAARQPAVPTPERPTERAAAPAPAPPMAVSTGRSDERCVANIDAATSHVALRPKKGKVVLGVLAGLKDASNENVIHLRALVAEVARRGAEVIVVGGDLGDSPEEQEMLLGVVAEPGVPVIAVAGNREVRTDLDAAESALRKRGTTVLDVSQARVIDLGDAMLVGLPGAYDRRQLRTDGACVYVQRDVEALERFLSKLPPSAPPALVVAAVPPKGRDARALDASDGQNLGDARLAALLQARRVPFGIFGQVWEAGGRAIDAAGAPVPPGMKSPFLYLNPGAAEQTPWPMADGSTSPGQAAVLTIEGRSASFEVVRRPAPAPTAAPPAGRAG